MKYSGYCRYHEEWSNGYCQRIDIKNISDATATWNVDVPIDGTPYQTWNGSFSFYDQILSVSGKPGTNETLSPGDSAVVGYCAYKLTMKTGQESVNGNNICSEVNLRSWGTSSTDWLLGFKSNGSIYSYFSANVTQTGDKVHADGSGWTDVIDPDEHVWWGYCATY